MAFQKTTSIAGKRNGETVFHDLSGHWKMNACHRYAMRHSFDFPIAIMHLIADTSGHGRGGHDGYWTMQRDGSTELVQKWREGSRVVK